MFHPSSPFVLVQEISALFSIPSIPNGESVRLTVNSVPSCLVIVKDVDGVVLGIIKFGITPVLDTSKDAPIRLK